MLDGIDVSEYQPGNIGALVPYDFLIAQATNGESYTTPGYRQQVDDALSRGKCAALYHFAEGGSIAAELASYARAVKPYEGRVLRILDWEGSAVNAGPAWRKAWLDAAQSEFGVRPVLYGSLSVVGSVTGENVWAAAYGSNPVTNGYQTPTRTAGVMRQYTSQGRLSGYGADLDLNKFWGTVSDWNALAGINQAATPVDIGDRMARYIWAPNRGGALVGETGFHPIANMAEAIVAQGTYGTPGSYSDAQFDIARQTAINMGAALTDTIAAKVAGQAPAATPATVDAKALAADVVQGFAAALANG